MAEANDYAAADKAIRRMDRDNLRAFNRLKQADFERSSIVQTVLNLYREQARKARKEYLGIGLEAYIFALWLVDTEFSADAARRMAADAITGAWVDDILRQTDFVTLYRFDSETERKANRLLEGLSVVTDPSYTEDWNTPKDSRNRMIDQALKQWVRQLAQYAINVTDYAMLQAYDDAGVEEVTWEDAGDRVVCADCHSRNGQSYRLDEVPTKHTNCRCRLRPKKAEA